MKLPFSLDYALGTIEQVIPGADPFIIDDYYQHLIQANRNPEQQLVVITNTNQQAEYLHNILHELSPQTEVYLCPDWGTLAYDQFNPAPQVVSDRLNFLQKLGTKHPGIYIISITTALHRLTPKDFLISTTNFFVGQKLDQKQTKDLLLKQGYREVEITYEPGEFSALGRNLDFFPTGSKNAYRINFFEGEIDRIREFDIESQAVIKDVDSINVIQGSEYPIEQGSIKTFLDNYYREFKEVNLDSGSVYALMMDNIIPQGAQYYLPLFFNGDLSTLADYLHSQTAVLDFSGFDEVVQSFFAENLARYQDRSQNNQWPPMAVERIYLQPEEFYAQVKDLGCSQLTLNRKQATEIDAETGLTEISPMQVSRFLPLGDLQPDYLENSIGKREQPEADTAEDADDTDDNTKVDEAKFDDNAKAGAKASTTERSKSSKSASTDKSTAKEPLKSSSAASSSTASKKQSWIERAVSLGLDNFGRPITGSNTLASLRKNQLGFREVFASNLNDKYQYAKLVNFIRKVGANFKHIKLAITVASSGRISAFRDMISDLPIELVSPAAELNLGEQFDLFWQGKNSNSATNGANFGSLEANVFVSNLRSGLAYYDEHADTAYILLSEQDIIGSHIQRSRSLAQTKQREATRSIEGLMELRENQLVVHQVHGICRYLGLKTLEINPGFPEDMMELEFADTNLLIPVANINEISVYNHHVMDVVDRKFLSSVSGARAKQWLKKKSKALSSIFDMAAELLLAQSRRALEQGYQFTLYERDYQEFSRQFKYQETPDQYATIQTIIEDMCSTKKMERLVCGDVGFGKTEVAMRAAFIAITNAKQVAILVPTTLLAQQHYESFRDRFAFTGANVELLSSFNTPQENAKTIAKIKSGLVDIVIGTHALLSDTVQFKDLGLLIVDEEHQFGVNQKEKLKRLKNNVDVITMTATPIPRTLGMALNGFRDISLITTAPENRLNIITQLISRDDESTIRDAINREIMRGGQVFFIHNDIETMPSMARFIQELVPHSRITYVNGQMSKHQLEDRMLAFHNQRFNVLVCSTIIETGIDIPNANTIIINNAQNFGMAQLHQLRGRVGRSFRQAYAYLISPNLNSLREDSVLRLNAMVNIPSLGAGYILATHDLEIRGAGEILGEKQSGKVDEIGYSLYMTMLQNAVKQLKRNQAISLETIFDKNIDVNLGISMIIPASYIKAPNVRVYYYQQISNARTELLLNEIASGMISRFGELPPSVRVLFMVSKLKLRIHQSGISSIHGISYQRVNVEFDSFKYVQVEKLQQMALEHPEKYALAESSFAIKNLEKDPFARIREIAQTLNQVLDLEKLAALQHQDDTWTGQDAETLERSIKVDSKASHVLLGSQLEAKELGLSDARDFGAKAKKLSKSEQKELDFLYEENYQTADVNLEMFNQETGYDNSDSYKNFLEAHELEAKDKEGKKSATSKRKKSDNISDEELNASYSLPTDFFTKAQQQLEAEKQQVQAKLLSTSTAQELATQPAVEKASLLPKRGRPKGSGKKQQVANLQAIAKARAEAQAVDLDLSLVKEQESYVQAYAEQLYLASISDNESINATTANTATNLELMRLPNESFTRLPNLSYVDLKYLSGPEPSLLTPEEVCALYEYRSEHPLEDKLVPEGFNKNFPIFFDQPLVVPSVDNVDYLTAPQLKALAAEVKAEFPSVAKHISKLAKARTDAINNQKNKLVIIDKEETRALAVEAFAKVKVLAWYHALSQLGFKLNDIFEALRTNNAELGCDGVNQDWREELKAPESELEQRAAILYSEPYARQQELKENARRTLAELAPEELAKLESSASSSTTSATTATIKSATDSAETTAVKPLSSWVRGDNLKSEPSKVNKASSESENSSLSTSESEITSDVQDTQFVDESQQQPFRNIAELSELTANRRGRKKASATASATMSSEVRVTADATQEDAIGETAESSAKPARKPRASRAKASSGNDNSVVTIISDDYIDFTSAVKWKNGKEPAPKQALEIDRFFSRAHISSAEVAMFEANLDNQITIQRAKGNFQNIYVELLNYFRAKASEYQEQSQRFAKAKAERTAHLASSQLHSARANTKPQNSMQAAWKEALASQAKNHTPKDEVPKSESSHRTLAKTAPRTLDLARDLDDNYGEVQHQTLADFTQLLAKAEKMLAEDAQATGGANAQSIRTKYLEQIRDTLPIQSIAGLDLEVIAKNALSLKYKDRNLGKRQLEQLLKEAQFDEVTEHLLEYEIAKQEQDLTEWGIIQEIQLPQRDIAAEETQFVTKKDGFQQYNEAKQRHNELLGKAQESLEANAKHDVNRRTPRRSLNEQRQAWKNSRVSKLRKSR